MPMEHRPNLPIAILDILPTPVLVKDSDLKYVWVNRAFEDLFGVKRTDLVGQLDVDVFPDRQAAQCNGGDTRVLQSGVLDEAYETVYRNGTDPRVTITRKNRLTDGGDHFLIGIMHDITDVTEANHALEVSKRLLEEQSEKLREMAYIDPLTGVMNRRRLAETAPVIFGTHRNIGGAVLCDLDFFKKINDSYGHDAGDAALKHFVTIASFALREGDLIARLGGEEFAMLLPGTLADTCFEIAERVRQTLEATPLDYNGDHIKMTVSMGVSLLTGGEFDLDTLLRRADECLYRAKNGGRNTVILAA